VGYCKFSLGLGPSFSSLVSVLVFLTILILIISLLFLLQLVVASSFCLFFLFFRLGFALVVLQSLFSICVGDVFCCFILLSVSPSWLGFPFGLPVGLCTAFFLLLLSVASVFILSISSVVFVLLSVVCCDKGGKLNWFKLWLPISDGFGDIYTGFSGQYGFVWSLAFASSTHAVSFL